MPQSNGETQAGESFAWLDQIDQSAYAGVAPVALRAVRAAYDSPGRFYHTWTHIEACLGEYRRHQFENPRAVLLALLFHDAIYVAGRRDNEQMSAVWARTILADSIAVSAAELTEIATMIGFTASHHAVGSPSDDAKKMLDIDLSILGAEAVTFDAYARNVRREFCPAVVSEFKFCVGRLKFLRAMQKQTHIFLTDEMRARLEARARQNIAREIAALEAEAGFIGRLLARLV